MSEENGRFRFFPDNKTFSIGIGKIKLSLNFKRIRLFFYFDYISLSTL